MNKLNFKTVLAAGSLAMGSAFFSTASIAGEYVIDDFSGPVVNVQADSTNDNVTQTAFASQTGSMLGGFRNVIVTNSSDSTQSVSATVGGGEFAFASGNSTGAVQIQWDGNASPLFDPTGLGSVDFSGFDAFALNVLVSDDNFFFRLGLYTDANTFSILDLEASEVTFGSPQTFNIDFALFSDCGLSNVTCGNGDTAPVDFASIGGVYAGATGAARVDFTLTQASAVPAPGALALMGLGLVGLAGVARRKKQA